MIASVVFDYAYNWAHISSLLLYSAHCFNQPENYCMMGNWNWIKCPGCPYNQSMIYEGELDWYASVTLCMCTGQVWQEYKEYKWGPETGY